MLTHAWETWKPPSSGSVFCINGNSLCPIPAIGDRFFFSGVHMADKSTGDFGVIVVGVQHSDRRMDFNPPPDSPMRAGDKLVVLGRADSLKQLESEASVR